MRPLYILLVTAVLALFGACPSVPAALGDVLGLVFGGAAQIVAQPALLLGAFVVGVAVIARRSRHLAH
ncbi:hypothetical protein [Streptomyces sp. NBC_00356]|uniref:hypothetical protein n=1 Tax=Streptomyces sp. NBC_00356 TaxID=2975724 RepID=UPI002E27513D